MPAYNAGKYLKFAIDSILNQSYKDFELIIINDGSTDNTEEVILSYDDPRIIYIKNEQNLKLIKTLNKGIDVAHGDYISRMDSDDIAFPSLFEQELSEFEKHHDAGIVNILTYHLDESGKHIRPNRQYFAISPEACSCVCFYANMISHPGVMVRGDLMRQYRYKDSTDFLHFEDMEIWNRMFMDGIKCYTINKRLLYYRESNASINAKYAQERYTRIEEFRHSYLKQRWNFEWKSHADICDTKSFCNHFYSLLKLWNCLKNTKQINKKLYFQIILWQIHFFTGIAKRVVEGHIKIRHFNK